jgi:hypothetical protein
VLFIDFSRKELEDAKGTIGKNYYDTIQYRLEKLDKFHPNLTFQQLDYNFLQKYAYYLTAKGNKPTTMKSDIVMIRKFLNLATKKGLTKNYPFADFTIPTEEAVKEYLTLQEVERLHNLYATETLPPKLQNTLFYFLLACSRSLNLLSKCALYGYILYCMDNWQLLCEIEERNKRIEARIDELNEINLRLRQKQEEIKQAFGMSKEKFNFYLSTKQNLTLHDHNRGFVSESNLYRRS